MSHCGVVRTCRVPMVMLWGGWHLWGAHCPTVGWPGPCKVSDPEECL